MILISLRRSFVVNSVFKFFNRMASTDRSYEAAVRKLNALQSNKSTIEQIKRAIKSGQERCSNIQDMENYLARTGVSMSQLDELSVIHVAGTKGKGSTSAMCESILRAHGARTGLYTSPHLVAVRERIRLDGAVIARDTFARHFHRVYDMLHDTQAYEGDMPKYFAFLTVLAYNMFLSEKVDVAVVEVGIGGIVDYTNVLRKVPIVGITALGLDHTSILGTTIQEIAAAKAGIMKRDCEAYTVQQPPDAMTVLERVADQVQCSLTQVPEYSSYKFPPNTDQHITIDIEAYKTNASLAIQLAHAWLRITKVQMVDRRRDIKKQLKVIGHNLIDFDAPFHDKVDIEKTVLQSVPNKTVMGLKDCRWPGRYQIIQSDYAKFYIDGAHTKESLEICAKWFEGNNRSEEKILIFSSTGDRDAEIMLRPLRSMHFTKVYFVIPHASKSMSEKSDNYSILEQKDLIDRCKNNAQAWKNINQNSIENIYVFECVSDALVDIKRNSTNIKSSVLITGSLHLVGAALSILDPSLSAD